jgi:hypothetical protein
MVCFCGNIDETYGKCYNCSKHYCGGCIYFCKEKYGYTMRKFWKEPTECFACSKKQNNKELIKERKEQYLTEKKMYEEREKKKEIIKQKRKETIEKRRKQSYLFELKVILDKHKIIQTEELNNELYNLYIGTKKEDKNI